MQQAIPPLHVQLAMQRAGLAGSEAGMMLARRTFVGRTAAGLLGSMGLASLSGLLRHAHGQQPGGDLASPADASAVTPADGRWRGVVQPLHVPQRARRVIFLYMSGGPSQFETFDYKPELARRSGEPMPEPITAGQPIAQLQGQRLVCLGPLFKFQRWGASGQYISEVLPHTASIADEICIIRSMHTDQINHDPAHTVMNTGTAIPGRPSMGSWILYGLGSEAEDLPGFVVLTSKGGRNPQPIAARQWHSGFLPGEFQGIELHTAGEPVHYVQSPAGVDGTRQQEVVQAVARLNRLRGEDLPPETVARIRQYELAFRMQTSVPGLIDLSDEPQHVLDLYGARGLDGSFAANCILARRLAERGVRFIQLYHRGWDHHNDLRSFMHICAGHCDRASAALVKDLRQRGMLDDTLVIWGGEFGRTPMAQTNKGEEAGRDHHMRAFSMWLAGGGVQGGLTYGTTDDLGYHVAENPVHVHDLHATILHLLGIDHRRLTWQAQGRQFRLTDVGGQVVHAILRG
jgi:hypothetical protein